MTRADLDPSLNQAACIYTGIQLLPRLYQNYNGGLIDSLPFLAIERIALTGSGGTDNSWFDTLNPAQNFWSIGVNLNADRLAHMYLCSICPR